MTGRTERVLFWDDELEQLSTLAIGLLGEDTVAVAIESTRLRLAHARNSVSFDAFKDALKAELRRVMRPH